MQTACKYYVIDLPNYPNGIEIQEIASELSLGQGFKKTIISTTIELMRYGTKFYFYSI